LDLFNQRPLYVFSGLAARTAFGLVILNLVVDATTPGAFSQPGSLGLTLFLVIMALVTFLWPLMGVHRQLQEEKGRFLGETTRRFLAATTELHHRVDEDQFSAMDEIDATLSSLAQEEKKIAAIPTWPWQPDQLRLLVSTILLPIVLWVAQQILAKIIGR
jgi:high-affinity nickel permease